MPSVLRVHSAEDEEAIVVSITNDPQIVINKRKPHVDGAGSGTDMDYGNSIFIATSTYLTSSNAGPLGNFKKSLTEGKTDSIVLSRTYTCQTCH